MKVTAVGSLRKRIGPWSALPSRVGYPRCCIFLLDDGELEILEKGVVGYGGLTPPHSSSGRSPRVCVCVSFKEN